MNQKLTEILKKAKAVEQRANQMGNKKNSGTHRQNAPMTVIVTYRLVYWSYSAFIGPPCRYADMSHVTRSS